MLKFLHGLGSPPRFHQLSRRLTPWLGGISLILLLAGLYGGLVLAPADYQQGDSYRIIFIHVPSAWMSLFVYVLMACFSVAALVWRVKVAEALARASAPLGASFTFLALVTGSLWGKPMWGAWWVWDARLTSELILLFLYLGFMALQSAIEDPRQAARAAGLLSVVGLVNIPIIHYSVVWWNTLHQGSTVIRAGGPAMDTRMLIPLLIMAMGFMFYFAAAVLIRARSEVLERSSRSRWARAVLENDQ